MTNEHTPTETPAEPSLSPGQQLKRGRESMGLSQQQVADRLHLRLNNIADIESDTHPKGVSITFTKGYVRIYAKLLGMDAQPLLEQFDSLHNDEKTPAKLQSFSRRVAKEANDERWMLVTYLMLFLVVASVVIWWFQQSDKPFTKRIDEISSGVLSQVTSLGSEDNSDATEELAPVPEEQQEEAVTPEVVEESFEDSADIVQQEDLTLPPSMSQNAMSEPELTTEDASAQSNLELVQPEPIQQAIQEPVQEPVPELSEVSASESQSDAQIADVAVDDSTEAAEQILEQEPSSNDYVINSDGTVEVVFTLKDDCWVSVKDANNETMAYGVKTKGRVMTVSGVPPVKIILGAPQNVEINFGGQDIDMTAFTPGRSANFRLPLESE